MTRIRSKITRQESLEMLDESIISGAIIFIPYDNAPSMSIESLSINNSTEKAINVTYPHTNLSVWLPKSALTVISHHPLSGACYTLASWFRKSLLDKKETYVFRALGM